jgi:hypothetical protein
MWWGEKGNKMIVQEWLKIDELVIVPGVADIPKVSADGSFSFLKDLVYEKEQKYYGDLFDKIPSESVS